MWQLVKLVVMTRERIKLASRQWVGVFDENKTTGAVVDYTNEVNQKVEECLGFFKSFITTNLHDAWFTGGERRHALARTRAARRRMLGSHSNHVAASRGSVACHAASRGSITWQHHVAASRGSVACHAASRGSIT